MGAGDPPIGSPAARHFAKVPALIAVRIFMSRLRSEPCVQGAGAGAPPIGSPASSGFEPLVTAPARCEDEIVVALRPSSHRRRAVTPRSQRPPLEERRFSMKTKTRIKAGIRVGPDELP